mmetsp:Transcript_108124/g.187685  ORF Transcript_108124/g.187685 Transcript_108124/m.187685 type:complete len:379 (+) Transcript_108124:81-1217(+)
MDSATVYGLDKELKSKQEAKFDKGLESNVRYWIESVTGHQSGEQTMAEYLKDGQVLCALANAVRPGMIKKVNTSKLPFKQMENITFFMNAAREMGVPESSLFGTPDLYEEKNMGSVITCVYMFAGIVQVACRDFPGPALGQAIQPDTKDKKRIVRQVTQSGGLNATLEHQRATTFARAIVTDTADQLDGTTSAPSLELADTTSLDADLRAKQAAKFDVGLEDQVCKWIETLTGETKGERTSHEWLKSGEVLCRLANSVKPGMIKKVNSGSMPFKQMENITFFMNAARRLGVPESSMFGTPDLYEEKNMWSVISCIYAFGGAVQVACPEFKGPNLGTALTSFVTDKRRPDHLATSQYESMQRKMEVERPRDSGIMRGAN